MENQILLLKLKMACHFYFADNHSQNNLLSTNKNSYSSNALNGNPKNLKKGTCDFVKVMKKYSGMPDWLKQKGILYVHEGS